MVELLVRTIDNSHKDANKDRWTYKKNDVVVSRPDGHQFGRLESAEVWANEIRTPEGHGLFKRREVGRAILLGDVGARGLPEAACFREGDWDTDEQIITKVAAWSAEIDAWMAAPHTLDNFPGGFAILRLTGLIEAAARQYTAERVSTKQVADPDFDGEFSEVMDDSKPQLKRNMSVDYEIMEQRAAVIDDETGLRRDTLTAYGFITRDYAEVSDKFTAKSALLGIKAIS